VDSRSITERGRAKRMFDHTAIQCWLLHILSCYFSVFDHNAIEFRRDALLSCLLTAQQHRHCGREGGGHEPGGSGSPSNFSIPEHSPQPRRDKREGVDLRCAHPPQGWHRTSRSRREQGVQEARCGFDGTRGHRVRARGFPMKGRSPRGSQGRNRLRNGHSVAAA